MQQLHGTNDVFGISSSARSNQIITAWKYTGIEFCARTYTIGCGLLAGLLGIVLIGWYKFSVLRQPDQLWVK